MEWEFLSPTMKAPVRITCAVILIVIGSLAVAAGTVDIFGASAFIVRLLALFFLLGGYTLIVAAGGLLLAKPWAGSLALSL